MSLSQRPGPDIQLGPETESAQGWVYANTHIFQDGRHEVTELRLSYPDYDHWSRGATPPSHVAQRALIYALTNWPNQQRPQPWPAIIDCSTLRRHLPELDAAMKSPVD